MNQSSHEHYQSLFRNFCQIYETTLLQTEATQGAQKSLAYLSMGKTVAKMLGQAEKEGVYGKKLVPTLCRDLKDKYGNGPSTRTIRYMRKFAASYDETNLHPALCWSHYCILLSIEDTAVRKQLEQQAITEHLQRDKLQQLVSLHHQRTDHRLGEFPLSPRKGTPQIGKVVRSAPGRRPLLDVGFGVLHAPGTANLSKYNTGTFLRRYANGKRKPVLCVPGERYCYLAELDRVIDGDTVKMRVQLTPGIFITERFRLRGIDAMERDTPEGQRATRTLQRWLKNKKEIIIYTYSTDRYGRYVADIVADKIYINKQLLKKGLARYLPMKTD